jgi:hypothetical protein
VCAISIGILTEDIEKVYGTITRPVEIAAHSNHVFSISLLPIFLSQLTSVVVIATHSYSFVSASPQLWHFISNHLISNHFISNHFISNHFISNHFISNHFISNHFISNHFISNHFISNHFISNHFISNHFISNHIAMHLRLLKVSDSVIFCGIKSYIDCYT